MATVAIIDSHAHPAAAAYYNAFSEPLAGGTSVKVGNIVRLPKMRLDQLPGALSSLNRRSDLPAEKEYRDHLHEVPEARSF